MAELYAAAEKGEATNVKRLLDAQADVAYNVGNWGLKWTPLHTASANGHTEIVKMLIVAKAPLEAKTCNGDTPFHEAVRRGHTAVVEVLISAGALLNAQDYFGDTLLHTAARNNRHSIIRVLIASGASADLKNINDETPREVANNTATRRVIDRALLLESKYEVQVPLDRVKVFLCGDGAVGKSTLARALQRGDFSMRFKKLPKAVDKRTHGFDSFPATIPTAGACTIVDFAGQPEYWAPNSVFMDTESGVFVVLCKLTDPIEKQFEQLRYWVRFIGSQSQSEKKPRVVLVGTHRGADRSRESESKLIQNERITATDNGLWYCHSVETSMTSLRNDLGHLVDLTARFHYVDSVNPAKGDRAEMASLRTFLDEAMADIRATRTMPKVCADVIDLLPAVRKALPAVAPFTAVQQELERLDKERKINVHNVDRMKAVLGYLSKAGHVMYFEEIGGIVVVDPQAFGTHVIGQLFCPLAREGFTSLVLTKGDGLHFRESQLKACLQRGQSHGYIFGDVAVVLKMLVALQLVIPVSPSITSDALADADAADADPLYAVPGRLSAAVDGCAMQRKYLIRPDDCWNIPHDHTQWFYAGVRLKVSESQLMIPPSLFPRLQHRLSKEPTFRMWRGGLSTRVLTDTGDVAAEGIVELDRSLEHMDVCVRSATGDERGCIETLRRLVTACQGFDVFFTTTIITRDSMRRHVEGGRQADQPDPGAPRVMPSEWVDTRFARLLQPHGGRHRVFVSYVARESDSTFKLLVSALRGRGYEVFEPNTGLIAPSMTEMQARVAESAVVLAVLSPGYFKSRYCCAEAAEAGIRGITVIPVYDGDKHLHSANESHVLGWKAEETRASTQALRDYVYRGNVVRAVDTQDQTAAIESVFTAIAERCPHLRPGYVPRHGVLTSP